MRACVFVCVYVCVGGGVSLCKPQVISRDQAFLMRAGSSRGHPGVTQCTSHARLSQPAALSGCILPPTGKLDNFNFPAKSCSLTVHCDSINTAFFFLHFRVTFSNLVKLLLMEFQFIDVVCFFIYFSSLFCLMQLHPLSLQRKNPTERHRSDFSRNEWRLHQ